MIENVVKEPTILVCNSVGGVVGLRAAIDRYVRNYMRKYLRSYIFIRSMVIFLPLSVINFK